MNPDMLVVGFFYKYKQSTALFRTSNQHLVRLPHGQKPLPGVLSTRQLKVSKTHCKEVGHGPSNPRVPSCGTRDPAKRWKLSVVNRDTHPRDIQGTLCLAIETKAPWNIRRT
jgi:hypothetical protein